MIDTGMPQEWQQILDDNGITRAEQEENPEKVRLIQRKVETYSAGAGCCPVLPGSRCSREGG